MKIQPTGTNYNNSKPYFGNFSEGAMQLLTPAITKGLVNDGKIALSEIAYLKQHSLTIAKTKMNSAGKVVKGEGLAIVSDAFPSKKENLTPLKFKFIPLSEEFQDIHRTLGQALKKALKLGRKVDKINAEKTAYFEKHGEKIDNLGGLISKLEDEYNKAVNNALAGKVTMSDEATAETLNELASAKFEFSCFKTKNSFDKKIEKLFTGSTKA